MTGAAPADAYLAGVGLGRPPLPGGSAPPATDSNEPRGRMPSGRMPNSGDERLTMLLLILVLFATTGLVGRLGQGARR
jgi:hypothetical protein